MRLSSVSEISDVPSPFTPQRVKQVVAASLGVVVAALIVWISVTAWRSSRPTEDAARAPLVTSAQEDASAARLSTADALWLLSWRNSPGVHDAATLLLGARQGLDAARVLADVLRSHQQAQSLSLIDAPLHPPRPALSPWLFSDDTLSLFLSNAPATLYPDEVTLLLWVIAQEAGLTVQLVWLDPQAPTLDRWPCVALRFPTDQGALALDPRTGDLLQASEQTPYGPELLFSALSLIDAREALSRDDLPVALRALDRAQRLTPDLWTVHALRAQSALSLPNATDALSTARASLDALAASSSTHPLAWYTTALAAATTPAGLDLNTLTPHLQALVDSNPAEARLAVTLGDHLRDLHQYSAAWDAYDLALSRQPSIPGAHTGLAWLYALSDPARAREHLRAELSQNPHHAPLYLAHAFLLASHGDPAAAQEIGSRGLRFSPNPDLYTQRLASTLQHAQQHTLP
jgi:hypothetical protein